MRSKRFLGDCFADEAPHDGHGPKLNIKGINPASSLDGEALLTAQHRFRAIPIRFGIAMTPAAVFPEPVCRCKRTWHVEGIFSP